MFIIVQLASIMFRTFRILILLYSTVPQNYAKQFLIQTRLFNVSETVPKDFTDKHTSDDEDRDYMAEVNTKSVHFGDSFVLRCDSHQDIEKCFFSKNGVRYRVRKGTTFNQKRLQCLCDVSFCHKQVLI